MRRLLPLFVAGFAVLPAWAAVEVSFNHPEKFSDVGFREIDPALFGIEQHLKSLGDRYLPSNYSLKVEVLDVDLAGRLELWRQQVPETRVVRGRGDGPIIHLRYVLESEGRVITRGDETISDRDYLMRSNQYISNEALRYEKRMLEDWFKARFVERIGVAK